MSRQPAQFGARPRAPGEQLNEWARISSGDEFESDFTGFCSPEYEIP